MTDMTLAEQLQDIIEQERAALKLGDFDAVAELFEKKEALASQLEEFPAQRSMIEPLRDGLRRNQELFDQALAGLRNVANRLGDMNRVRRALNTYDAQGRSQIIDAPATPTMERRA